MQTNQLTFIETAILVSDEFTSDDWETPQPVARYFGEIVKEKLTFLTQPSDFWQPPKTFKILDAGAGTGNITQFVTPQAFADLEVETTAIEIKPGRVEAGKKKAAGANWICGDVSDLPRESRYHTIVSNPPFGKEAFPGFFNKLSWLLEDRGSLILLLPSTFFQTQWGAKSLIKSPLKIAQKIEIIDRIAYEKNGIPQPNRQCYDAIFVLRRTAINPIKFIDPYGKLGAVE